MDGALREEVKKRLRYIDEIEEWLEQFSATAAYVEATDGDDCDAPNVEAAFDAIRDALRLLL